jgi:hypothetical protein
MIVVDGHTRRQVAVELGISVSICVHAFATEEEALDYAIANQRNRRNLTDAELASLVMAVDARKQRGSCPGGHGNQHTGGKPLVKASRDAFTKSAETTAELAGTSPRKVEKVRAIMDYAEETGDTAEKDAVLSGKLPIHRASVQVREKQKKRRAPQVAPATPVPVMSEEEARKAIPKPTGQQRAHELRLFDTIFRRHKQVDAPPPAPRTERLFARLVAPEDPAASKWRWQEVIPAQAGGWTEGMRSGIATEANKLPITTCPVVVLIYRSAGSDLWRFWADAG